MSSSDISSQAAFTAVVKAVRLGSFGPTPLLSKTSCTEKSMENLERKVAKFSCPKTESSQNYESMMREQTDKSRAQRSGPRRAR